MQQLLTLRPFALLLIGLLTNTIALGGQIDVHISGISSDEGKARIVLMTGLEEYSGQRPVTLTESVPIRGGVARWQIEMPTGTYAIIAHHDKDADNTLDRPLFALPIERYGYSNDAWTSLGLPAFGDVAFNVSDGVIRQHIHLRTNAFVTLAQLSALAGIAIVALFGALTLYRRYPFQHHHSA